MGFKIWDKFLGVVIGLFLFLVAFVIPVGVLSSPSPTQGTPVWELFSVLSASVSIVYFLLKFYSREDRMVLVAKIAWKSFLVPCIIFIFVESFALGGQSPNPIFEGALGVFSAGVFFLLYLKISDYFINKITLPYPDTSHVTKMGAFWSKAEDIFAGFGFAVILWRASPFFFSSSIWKMLRGQSSQDSILIPIVLFVTSGIFIVFLLKLAAYWGVLQKRNSFINTIYYVFFTFTYLSFFMAIIIRLPSVAGYFGVALVWFVLTLLAVFFPIYIALLVFMKKKFLLLNTV